MGYSEAHQIKLQKAAMDRARHMFSTFFSESAYYITAFKKVRLRANISPPLRIPAKAISHEARNTEH